MNTIVLKNDSTRELHYNFLELETGFKVTGSDRLTTEVRLGNKHRTLSITSEGRAIQSLGLFQYYYLVDIIATNLVINWKPKGKTTVPSGVMKWKISNTARAINKRVHVQWKRLLSLADPTALKVQKATFAASRNCSVLSIEDDLYAYPWLVEDITKYPAAAISTLLFPRLIHNLTHKSIVQLDDGIVGAEYVDDIFETESFITIQDENETLGTTSSISIAELEMVKNWQDLYSYNGKAHRSLSRTLMNLPGGIPMYLLWRLGFIKLPRPITNRLELSLVLGYLRYEIRNPNWHVIFYARSDQIKIALSDLSDYVRRNLNHRKWSNIQYLAMYLHDYPYKHKGNIVGLIRKSIEWHRDVAAIQIENEINNFDNTDALLPPIPLPITPGINFLKNIDEIKSEGKLMNNCIAYYAKRAVTGSSYLFHIERDGEKACGEVDKYGRVNQVYGPRNKINNASVWGKRELYNWGRRLAEYQRANSE